MVPDRSACEAPFRYAPGRFWASEITAGGSVRLQEATAHVGQLGLAGAVLDFRRLARFRRGVRRAEGLGFSRLPRQRRPTTSSIQTVVKCGGPPGRVRHAVGRAA